MDSTERQAGYFWISIWFTEWITFLFSCLLPHLFTWKFCYCGKSSAQFHKAQLDGKKNSWMGRNSINFIWLKHCTYIKLVNFHITYHRMRWWPVDFSPGEGPIWPTSHGMQGCGLTWHSRSAFWLLKGWTYSVWTWEKWPPQTLCGNITL